MGYSLITEYSIFPRQFKKTKAKQSALNFDTGNTSLVTKHIFVHYTVARILVCGRYLLFQYVLHPNPQRHKTNKEYT